MKILFNELKKYKISILLILVGTYISTTFELTLPLLLANALNVGITLNYGLSYIENIAIMMLVLIIIIITLNILVNYLITRTSSYCALNIRNDLFAKVLTLKSKEFNNYSLSSLITRTNQDIEQVKSFISSFLSIIFKGPILLFSCITVLKTLNTTFFILITVSVTILLLFLIAIVYKLIPISKKIELSLDNLNKHLSEKISGYKLIKSYNNVDIENSKFEKENHNHLLLSKKVIKYSSFVNPFLNLIVNTITIIILSMSLNLVKTNAMEAGTIIATIQYILQLLLAIVMISLLIINFPTIKVSLNRIEEIIDAESFECTDESQKLKINSISFNNVSFDYEDTSPLLKDLTFSINKGENLGIIGLNGSGKSTVFKLLLKELNLKNGEIKINETSLEELSRSDITNQITYVPQRPYILKGTLIENIAFANSTLTMNDISKIIHTCNLENFILSKKEQFNYLLQENGSNLSGGQKQRISLARALARNKDFLILDEPFSALDYNTEKEILSKINQYYNDTTFVIISQRISSILHCKKIIVLDRGKIIATGTHEELLKTCSLYKEIFNTQKEVIEYDI